MNRLYTVAIVLGTMAIVSPPTRAESIPNLAEIREAIDVQAKKISDALNAGFSYSAGRYFIARVPEQHLPERLTRRENESGRLRESYLQEGDRRALATRHDDENNQVQGFESSVTSWDGEFIRRYEPHRWSATIMKPGYEEENGVPEHYFARAADPFTSALLPVVQPSKVTRFRFHDQVDVRELLMMEGIKILDRIDRLDDSNCIVIANEIGSFLWLDKDRGFVMKQYKRSDDDEFNGIDYYHYYNEAFAEVSEGLWAVEHGFILLRGPGIGYQHVTTQDYLAQIMMRFSDIRFHESVDDDAFRLIYPAGTEVVTMEGNRGTSETVGFVRGRATDKESTK